MTSPTSRTRSYRGTAELAASLAVALAVGAVAPGAPATAASTSGDVVDFDDLDLDGFRWPDLEALAGVEIIGEPDCAAPAADPAPRTPAWDQRDKENRFCAMQGELDLLRNPAIVDADEQAQADRAAADPEGEAGEYVGDPFREPLTRWDGRRGQYDSIRYTGPDGATRFASMFRPLDECAGRRTDGCPEGLPRSAGPPYPGVLLVCHVCSGTLPTREAADPYIWAAETLAEAGYMVFAAPTPAELALDFFVATPRQPTAQGEANPFWRQLDRDRLGMMGHSGAGVVSLTVGQADPRVDAVVSWDRARSLDARTLDPTTPTLFLTGDADYFYLDEDFQPMPEPLDPPAPGTKWADLDLFRQAEVPSMLVSLRAGAHGEWTRSMGSFITGSDKPACALCSRYGQQVSAYYTLAWFDRYLKGAVDGRIARDGLARLTATRFDDSADVGSIGMGRFDPEVGNVPVTIAGMSVVDRLSFYRTSGYWLGDGRAFQCEDMRAGLRSGRCHTFARPST